MVDRVRVAACVAVAVAAALLGRPAAAELGQPDPPQIESGVAPGATIGDIRPDSAFADPTVAGLQRTATDVQRELAGLADDVRAASEALRSASDTAITASTARREADVELAARQGDIDEYASAVYAASGQPNEMAVLLTAANPNDFLDGTAFVSRIRAERTAQVTEAAQRQRATQRAEADALAAERAAADRKVDLDRRSSDATNRAAAVSSELRATVAATDAAVAATQRAQHERNTATGGSWRAYLDRLAAAGVRPPSAAALLDPARLPAGLQPVPGQAGTPQAGVAQMTTAAGERLLVLPAETIAAVCAAVGTLGRPYVPGAGQGPDAYSCDGLVRAVFGGTGSSMPAAMPAALAEQFAVSQPVAAADAVPGDLVVLGPARYGVQGVGIVLDAKTMLTADARLASVVVTDLPAGDGALGFARPSLPARTPVAAPTATDGGLTWRCGGVQLPARAGEASGAWGGFPNGFIPPAALCPLGIGSHLLRCDAAVSMRALGSAFAATFGRALCVTDSYRRFEAQVRLYGVKPSLAAVPGTSNHGWGLAVDLCGGVQSFGTAEYGWFAATAGAFGWVNPGWAQPGRGREEPWHWEFVG